MGVKKIIHLRNMLGIICFLICGHGLVSALEVDSCPEGWTAMGESCLYFNPTALTWYEAKNRCMEMGAMLTSVHSFEEAEAVVDVIQHFGVWLGGTDEQVEGEWQWIDGTPFDMEKWHGREPTGESGENCLFLGGAPFVGRAAQRNGGFYDYNCNDTYYSVCRLN